MAIYLRVDMRSMSVYYNRMMANELAESIRDLELSNPEFAQLLRVSPRTVQQWLAGERAIPAVAEAYLDLFKRIPETMKAIEIARIRRKDDPVLSGFYSMRFDGIAGSGVGMLIFDRGSICGADESGVGYDGTYEPRPGNQFDVSVTVSVPPGVALITGVPPQPNTYAFKIVTTIPEQGEERIKLTTPFGPVDVVFRRVRDLLRAPA